MKVNAIAILGAVLLGGIITLAQSEGGRGGGTGTVILEQAPKDHSIAIPKEKLAQYLKDMDAKKLQTLRMIEGGKYNVNIRRITAAETGAGAPDHGRPVGGARGRRHAHDRRRAREGQDPRRPEPADQGGRRRLHPIGAAARRERRGQEHHLAQRALGHGLAGGFADGRRHLERADSDGPEGAPVARVGDRSKVRARPERARRVPPAPRRRPRPAVRHCRLAVSRRSPTATAAAASCSSRRSSSIRSWPGCG